MGNHYLIYWYNTNPSILPIPYKEAGLCRISSALFIYSLPPSFCATSYQTAHRSFQNCSSVVLSCCLTIRCHKWPEISFAKAWLIRVRSSVPSPSSFDPVAGFWQHFSFLYAVFTGGFIKGTERLGRNIFCNPSSGGLWHPYIPSRLSSFRPAIAAAWQTVCCSVPISYRQYLHEQAFYFCPCFFTSPANIPA